MNPTNDPHDDELRGLLRALGRASERRAPAFQRTWRAAKAARRTAAPPWRLAWAGAVAAAMVLCAVAVWPRKPVPVVAVPTASDDALPTDFLLTNNNDDTVGRLAGEIDALLRP